LQVTMIVPFPPGGATDVICRVFGERLSALWRQPVVIGIGRRYQAVRCIPARP